jgi:heme/copper-type cytochrome/quinol oxidase subunit 3
MHAEAHAAHPPTSTGLNTWKLGFWVFLGSETLFFGSFIATYLIYVGRSLQGPYPHDVLDIPLTTLSTFVLLMSSLAMVLALSAVQRDNRRGALLWLMMTAGLGSVFLGFQAYEFTHFYHVGSPSRGTCSAPLSSSSPVSMAPT